MKTKGKELSRNICNFSFFFLFRQEQGVHAKEATMFRGYKDKRRNNKPIIIFLC